ncbi:uncharacterized protein BX664DRAFT_336567 [Halteromyces radiatus]|uniref:uncharacterized protein n=1 Tax=Halteromyces radiatus TaxID=101107 RepID=UPI00221FB1A5|nr:uncharacterized protein BX664DRAFT_336567 [Halteromyces radiatus]KAI8086704.1 hypothetical protein BX664DRAFT_336567 [Halteromyces radiatus]
MGLSILISCCLLFISSIQATILVLSTNDTYMDRQAVFGPRLEQELIGHLSIPILSRYGCEPIDAPSMDWIALVERGKCSFADKVRAMQASQAKAVIIGDPHFNGWITMYATGNTSDILIPSMYVAQYQFKALELHSWKGPILVQLIRNEEASWSFTDMMIVIVLSPSVMMLVVYFTWKCREYQRHLRDLAPCHVVASLPSRLYRREKTPNSSPTISDDDADEECAICLEKYLDDDRIRTLPCHHEFHVTCIDTWLITRKKFCPICKFNICQAIQRQQEHPPLDNRLPPSHMNEQTPLLPC